MLGRCRPSRPSLANMRDLRCMLSLALHPLPPPPASQPSGDRPTGQGVESQPLFNRKARRGYCSKANPSSVLIASRHVSCRAITVKTDNAVGSRWGLRKLVEMIAIDEWGAPFLACLTGLHHPGFPLNSNIFRSQIQQIKSRCWNL